MVSYALAMRNMHRQRPHVVSLTASGAACVPEERVSYVLENHSHLFWITCLIIIRYFKLTSSVRTMRLEVSRVTQRLIPTTMMCHNIILCTIQPSQKCLHSLTNISWIGYGLWNWVIHLASVFGLIVFCFCFCTCIFLDTKHLCIQRMTHSNIHSVFLSFIHGFLHFESFCHRSGYPARKCPYKTKPGLAIYTSVDVSFFPEVHWGGEAMKALILKCFSSVR